MSGQRPWDDGIEAALAGGQHPPVGEFSLDLASCRWTWSSAIYRMYGFEPGEIVPTTELMLAHEHPENRVRLDHVLDAAARTGKPFCSVHRIRDARGRVRTLAVAGQGRRDPTGDVVAFVGYVIDVTSEDTSAQRRATETIHAVARQRATIDQATGVLMVAYGLGQQEAADLLERGADALHVSVASMGSWIVSWFSGAEPAGLPTREQVAAFLRPTSSSR